MDPDALDSQEEDEQLEEGEEDTVSSEEEENLEEYEIKDIEPRPYVSEGSDITEQMVQNLSSHNTRPLIKIRISRKRRDFATIATKFITAESPQPLEIRQTADASFKPENYRKVIDIGLQAGCGIKLIPQPKANGFQSTYFRTTNARVEFDRKDFSRTFSQTSTTTTDITEVPQIESFVRNVEFRIEEALQSNETIDVFHDEFEVLGDDDGDGSGNLANFMQEIRTFKSLEYTSGKYVSDVRWFPGRDDMIAASSLLNDEFQERVNKSGRNIPGSIIVWSFEEFANTVIVLKATQEVICFRFHPIHSNLLIGGMITGQVALWDTNLKHEKSKRELLPLQDEAPEMTHLVLSGIYDSHKGPVMDIAWLPNKVKIERKNLCAVYPDQEASTQAATLSEDGLVLIWETYFTGDKSPYKNMDYLWQPLVKLQLTRPEVKNDIGGSKICIEKDSENSIFWATSDSGDLLQVDWVASSIDESRPEYVKRMYNTEVAFRPALDLRVSPFFSDIILTVHDFHFCIWKESCATPIFTSYFCSTYFTCGDFSPVRPAVIFIGRSDGRLDMWDFLDQSHKESLFHSVTSNKITNIRFLNVRRSPQWVALGDAMGDVHIMEIARHTSKDIEREKRSMYEFWQREEQRVGYYEDRFTVRAEQATRAELMGYQSQVNFQKLNVFGID